MAEHKTHDGTCPHCGRPFTAELLAGAVERHRGFKCPHCRLFFPLERAEQERPATAEPRA